MSPFILLIPIHKSIKIISQSEKQQRTQTLQIQQKANHQISPTNAQWPTGEAHYSATKYLSKVIAKMSIVDLKGVSFKVIIIGQSGVGKTTLIHKYLHGEFLNQYNITVGVDFKSKTVHIEDRFVQLQIWDTCGQEVYRSVISSFYKGASAVFLVYDVSKRKTFEILDSWNQSFDKEGSDLALKFLIGTKCDLQRQVSMQQAQQYMKKINGSFYIQTSSLNGQNIDQLFEKTASALYKHYEGSEEFRRFVRPDTDSIIEERDWIKLNNMSEVDKKTLKKNKGCCK